MDVKDRDKEKKEKRKEYTDRKRNAKDCELEVRDKVYIKNATKENKLSLNFGPTTHTVEKSKGGDIQVRNDETGQLYRRNILHFKKVQGQWKVWEEDEEKETKDDCLIEEDEESYNR